MKILFNTSSLGAGGAERVISILSNNLAKENDIFILVNTLKNKSYFIKDKVITYELDKKNIKGNLLRNIYRIVATNRIIKSIKPDIIISFLPIPSFRVLCLKPFNKIPIIVSDRNNPNEEYNGIISKLLMQLLYKKADGFVFQTSEQKKFFPSRIQKKSIIILNPLAEKYVESDSDSTPKENTIITVGRLVEQKNQKMLIESFSKIVKTHSNYILKIYGDGPLKDTLTQLIIKLNLEKKVFLCGTTENIKEELIKAKVFILTSNFEGMPNALIEAMAVGLPCISTDCPCGGPKQLIVNNKNGILVKVGDTEGLTRKILELLDDKEKMKKIGRNAKLIVNKVAPSKIVKEWENYINSIFNESNAEKSVKK